MTQCENTLYNACSVKTLYTTHAESFPPEDVVESTSVTHLIIISCKHSVVILTHYFMYLIITNFINKFLLMYVYIRAFFVFFSESIVWSGTGYKFTKQLVTKETMTTHGKLTDFNPSIESWTAYAERLLHYFTANKMSVAKQKGILLTAMLAKT